MTDLYEPKCATDLLAHYAAVQKRLANAAGIGELKKIVQHLEKLVLSLREENSNLSRDLDGAKQKIIEIQLTQTARTTIVSIIRAICETWHVSKADLFSPRRSFNLTEPRLIGMALCTMLTHSSLPEIGRMWGDRDHTTVMNARNKYSEILGTIDLTPDNDPTVWAKAAYEKVHEKTGLWA